MTKVVYICNTCKGVCKTKAKKGKGRPLSVRCPVCNKSIILLNPVAQLVIDFDKSKEPVL